MRLQEIRAICLTALETWPELSFEEKRGAGGAVYYTLANADSVRALFSRLERVQALKEGVAAARCSSMGFDQKEGNITLDQKGRNTLSSQWQNLRSKVATIVDLFESVAHGQDNSGFDVKLPPKMTLSDLSKCAHDLDIIFSTCPLFVNQSGTITFSSVDIGSVWLSFAIGGAAAIGVLKLVAELVDKAIIIRSHYISAKEQEEQVRSLQLGNEVLENTINLQKEIGKGLLNKASNELAAEHNINDPEDLGRLKNSIQLLSDWMSKGMEVYASIQAKPEIKAVFPPIEKQALPESITALLTDGSERK